MPFGLAAYLAGNSKGTPMTCIVRTMWTLEEELQRTELTLIYRAFRECYPHVRVIVAANTALETDLLIEAGVEAILANHNMFVDERIFRPLMQTTPRYDAIYNAAFSPFKRRQLAADIATCVHVGYFADATMRQQALHHFEVTRQELPHHVFANPQLNRRIGRIPATGVNAILAEARVGLCLSAVEGAMTASMEYLMAGLPVVSTPSSGGRDRYFNPDFTIIAEPNPRAVREAVDALKARAIPRQAIRVATLKRVDEDRAAFNAFIENLRQGYPAIATDDARYPFHAVNNLYHTLPVSDFCKQLGMPLDYIDEPPDMLSLLSRNMRSETDA